MNAINKILKLSCQQAAILGAKAGISGLSYFERLKLKMHIRMCKPCEDYGKDSQLIDQAISKIASQKSEERVELTQTQKDKILKSIS